MIGYASNTGTKKNLEALRKAGWRVLLTPENPRRPELLYYSNLISASGQMHAFSECRMRK